MALRHAAVTLIAGAPAVFSEQPRTEGEHHTRLNPPGAALLGWAARGYDYWLERGKAEAVFNSGSVRFSDALPLSADGAPAYPIARLLMRPKHRQDLNANRLDARVQIGRSDVDEGETQYESIKSGFVTRAGAIVKPTPGGRLRTATRGGRAEKGKLFGFQHIESEDTRWVATIEADQGVLEDEEWEHLLSGFDGTTLYLGRGSNTAYGGGYECHVLDNDMHELWPGGSIAQGADCVRVWALSDLALVDSYGAPALTPNPLDLGLGAGWRLDAPGSVVSLRRYSGWNRTLHARDVERQVVAAGSVFTFTRVGGASPTVPVGLIGFAREAGLGRVWVNPPLLDAPGGSPWRGTPESVVFTINEKSTLAPPEAVPGWLAARRKLNSGRIGDEGHEQ